jgi:hypothetical protein
MTAVGLTAAASACVPAPPRPVGIVVTRVIDGDTVVVSSGQHVRLIGIDAPEVGSGPCATKATAKMAQLVLGRPVKLDTGARTNTDKYGRLLRYVDTTQYDFGRVLIRAGLAKARYDSRDGYGWHPREATYRADDALVPDCVNASTTPPPSGGGLDPRFATCTAAKQAHYGPYRRSVDPEYSWYTDADHDGIVCE